MITIISQYIKEHYPNIYVEPHKATKPNPLTIWHKCSNWREGGEIQTHPHFPYFQAQIAWYPNKMQYFAAVSRSSNSRLLLTYPKALATGVGAAWRRSLKNRISHNIPDMEDPEFFTIIDTALAAWKAHLKTWKS